MEHPLVAFLITGLFLGLFVYSAVRKHGGRRWPLLLPACVWVVYGLYETLLMRPWMERVIAPIRVDLLVIAPLLYVATIAGLIAWLIGLRHNG